MAEPKQKKNQNIQVFVRVRPINSREREIKSCPVIETPNSKEVLVRQGVHDKQSKKFTYDKVFGPESKQLEVYTAVVHPLIEEVLSGYSCTVFAYGQTGTGKTFTMAGGNPAVNSSQDPNSWQDDPMSGVIPRSLNHLFDELRLMQVEFSIRVSYLELYNEELFDLLSPFEDTSKGIRIYDDPSKKGSVVVHGLEEVPVTSKNEVFKIMARGQEKRKTAATLMNAQSSRSHTVFSIILHIKENSIEGEEFIKSGKLNLVDLAGSENISKAGNDKRERAREAVNINQSLLTLGRVITALVERTPHVPYRESKLTRLLQDSLGGRTKTSIIATISPGHKDLDETLSTLDYAYRAKNIQNKPEVNQKITQKVVLKEYTEEIERLRRDLAASRDKNGVYLAKETYNELTFKMDEQDREITEKLLQIRAYEEEIEKRDAIYKSITGTLAVKTEELEKTNEQLEHVHNQLEITQENLTKTKNVVLDKSHIIKKQVDTEKKLTLQAKTLVSVAEQTTSDAKRLQDSLDKRRHIDKQIKSTTQTFGDNLHQQLNQIEHQNIQYIECQTNFVNSVTQKLDEYTQIHQQSSKDFMSMINSVKDDQLNRIDALEANINEIKCSLTSKGQVHTQDMETKIEGLLQLLNDFKNTNVVPVVGKLNNFFKTENNMLERMNETFNKQSEQSLNRIKDLSHKHRGFCEDLEKFVVNSFATQKSHLQKAVNSQTKIAEDEAKYNKLMSTKLEECVQTMLLLQKAQSNRNNSIKEELENATEHLTDIQNETNDIETKISNTLQKNIAGNESFVEHCNKCQLDETNTMNHLYLKLNKSTTAHKSLFDELNKTTSALVTDATSGLKELEICQKVAHEACIEELNHSVEGNTQLLKGAADLVEQSMIEQLNTVVKQTDVTVSAFSEQIDQQKAVLDEVSQFKTDSAVNINNIRNVVDKYVSEDLKLYTPTGQTPARKDYQFPRKLVATSPHENILDRYRRRMHTTMEEEGSSEDENSSIVNLITPTKCSNARSTVEPQDMNATVPSQPVSSPTPLIYKSASEINLNNLPRDKTESKENFKKPQMKKEKSDHHSRKESTLPVSTRTKALSQKNV